MKMPGWGDHRGMGLDLATRRRVTAVMVRKYAKATRAEKSAILDHLVAEHARPMAHNRLTVR